MGPLARYTSLKAIVLDLDDTLYPERDFVRSGYDAVAAKLHADGVTDEPIGTWLWARALGGVFKDAYSAMNEHFQLGLSEEYLQELVACYRYHVPTITPFAEAPEVLAELKRKYKVGLLSDGVEQTQGNKLRALALPVVLDATLFTLARGKEFAKPSVLGFEAIAEELGVPHEACCYVGDNVSKDFIAPNALGWLTVRLVMPGQIYTDQPIAEGGSPQVEVHSWSTLGMLLGVGSEPDGDSDLAEG
jgi:putative hydrolase of the HAD superfamily